jgi:hypothetical protein
MASLSERWFQSVHRVNKYTHRGGGRGFGRCLSPWKTGASWLPRLPIRKPSPFPKTRS